MKQQLKDDEVKRKAKKKAKDAKRANKVAGDSENSLQNDNGGKSE